MTCSTDTITVGSIVVVTATFTNTAEAVVDPTAVSFKARDPSGNTATYVYGVDSEVAKTSTGIYTCDVTVDEAGWWRVWAIGTGTNAAASLPDRFQAIDPAA